MGHRVFGHESKCGHVHGHNYIGFFTAVAPDLDTCGRVIDFSVLKQRIMGWIDNNWDHGMVLCPNDPLVQVFRAATASDGSPQRFYLMPFGMNTTAEHMAHHLLHDVMPAIFADTSITITKIVLHETENGIAEVSL